MALDTQGTDHEHESQPNTTFMDLGCWALDKVKELWKMELPWPGCLLAPDLLAHLTHSVLSHDPSR